MSTNDSIVPGFDDDKDESIQISLQSIPNIDKGCLVSLFGFIDTYNSTFFQNQVMKLITANITNLVFDCSTLSTIASTGLGVLTNLLKVVQMTGGNIVLAAVQPNVGDVFDILGFSQFFNIKSTVEEGIAELGKLTGTTASTIFPKLFSCPCCGKSVRAPNAGRFRCMECKSILDISPDGNISLGGK